MTDKSQRAIAGTYPLIQASALSALPFLVALIAVNFAGWGMDWLAAVGWTKSGFHRKPLSKLVAEAPGEAKLAA